MPDLDANWSLTQPVYLMLETIKTIILDSHEIKTGSSAKMLSKEIATQMRGRALSREMFPIEMTNIKYP